MEKNQTPTPVDPSTPVDPPTPVAPPTDYIEALKQVRANSVSKEDYDKLKEDNKKLLQALIDGESIELETDKSESIDELRKSLFDSAEPLTNLQYASKMIGLRKKLIEAGEKDPFLPYGHQISPTQQDIEAANRVAKCLEECIEYADGDSSIFTNELQRRMIDTPSIRRR